MEIGLSHIVFGDRPLTKELCALWRDKGFANVELWVTPGMLDPFSTKSVVQVGEWMKKYGLTVNSVHGPSGIPGNGHWLADPDDRNRRRVIAERRAALEAARYLGAK